MQQIWSNSMKFWRFGLGIFIYFLYVQNFFDFWCSFDFYFKFFTFALCVQEFFLVMSLFYNFFIEKIKLKTCSVRETGLKLVVFIISKFVVCFYALVCTRIYSCHVVLLQLLLKNSSLKPVLKGEQVLSLLFLLFQSLLFACMYKNFFLSCRSFTAFIEKFKLKTCSKGETGFTLVVFKIWKFFVLLYTYVQEFFLVMSFFYK